jgi:hypothetical protein
MSQNLDLVENQLCVGPLCAASFPSCAETFYTRQRTLHNNHAVTMSGRGWGSLSRQKNGHHVGHPSLSPPYSCISLSLTSALISPNARIRKDAHARAHTRTHLSYLSIKEKPSKNRHVELSCVC